MTPDNEVTVFEHLFGTSQTKTVPKKCDRVLTPGNCVRIGKPKRTFDKGYLPKCTTESFRVTEQVRDRQPTVINLKT